jgi:serine/threonine-protein kinase
MADSSSDREPLEELAESFLARFRAGERPSLTEYTTAHPELAVQIRELFPALVEMEQAGSVGASEHSPALPVAFVGTEILQSLGDYRIIREVGRGGMGIVYEAVQESLGRHVALKVFAHRSRDDQKLIERFHREARAAARLHHTNIVPVFGVGEHAAHRYYAMQFIQGQGLDAILHELRRLRSTPQADGAGPAPPESTGPATLAATVARSLLTGRFATEATDEGDDRTFVEMCTASFKLADAAEHPAPAGDPPTNEASHWASQAGRSYARTVARVGLQVAEALEHAHGQGILHRDIKPSNLLLDIGGNVWVTDFGLAKSVDAEALTDAGDIVGTLRYMAPERFRGDSGAGSDVYGLGVTLYELLTLRPAFDEGERARLIDQILNTDPPPPRAVDSKIPRDLETVVLKAIAKHPADRYVSARALAEDLNRFLEDRTILARRSSVSERLWRWCKRNPGLAAANIVAATLVLVLAIGATIAAWIYRNQRNDLRTEQALTEASLHRAERAERETQAQRDLAQKNFHKAQEAVDDFFTQVSENTLLKSPLPGLQPLRRELLETAVKYYQGFMEAHRDEPALRAELAAAYFRVGKIRQEIGARGEAVQAYESARDLWEKLVHDNPADRSFEGRLAECLRVMGRLQTILMGEPNRGLRALQRAQDLYEELTRAEPDAPEFLSGLARTYGDLAICHGLRSQAIDELEFYRKAFKIWNRLAAAGRNVRRDLGTTAIDMGFCYTRAGQAAGALESFEKAREIFTELSRMSPTDTTSRDELRRVYINIGYLHQTVTGQHAEALRAYRRSAEIVERLARDHPAVTSFQTYKAGIYAQMSEVLLATEKYAEAKQLLQQAQEILERLAAADPTDWRARQWFARNHVQSGFAELGLKRFGEALAFSVRAQTIFDKLLRDNPDELENLRDLSQSLQLAGKAQEAIGQRTEALRSYRRAISRLEAIPEESLQHNKPMLHILIDCYTAIGKCERIAGERAEAERSYRHVLEIRQRHFESDNSYATFKRFCPAWIALGQLQVENGRPDEGRRTLKQARELIEKLPAQRGRDEFISELETPGSRVSGSGSNGSGKPD